MKCTTTITSNMKLVDPEYTEIIKGLKNMHKNQIETQDVQMR